ncbi:MAG: glutamate racemase [Lachnospiraceae bacterium]
MGSNLPIGVFDSGVGGLTVAKEIMNQLPNEQIIYFGDTARVPYGSKSKETVTAYSRQIVSFLLSKGVKAIVVACNTASAFALETIRHEIPVPIIGVVKPGAKTAEKTTRNGKIGVIGTEGTIKSGIYSEFLHELNPKVEVFGQACPLFVPLVEEGWANDPLTEEVVKRYLSGLLGKEIDTIVLGCTHYPLLRKVIGKVAGGSVTLVNPAYESARELKMVLEENHILNETVQVPKHVFYVSDGAEKFREFANSILPCEIIETKDVNIKTF